MVPSVVPLVVPEVVPEVVLSIVPDVVPSVVSAPVLVEEQANKKEPIMQAEAIIKFLFFIVNSFRFLNVKITCLIISSLIRHLNC